MIKYHIENGSSPWIVHFTYGEMNLWFGYPSFIKALKQQIKLWWKYKGGW